MSQTSAKKFARVSALHKVQDGLCCHCGKPMRLVQLTGGKTEPDVATLEHVFALAGFKFSNYRDHRHQLAAHYECNHARGSIPPSPELIEYLIHIARKRDLNPHELIENKAAYLEWYAKKIKYYNRIIKEDDSKRLTVAELTRREAAVVAHKNSPPREIVHRNRPPGPLSKPRLTLTISVLPKRVQ